MSATVFKYDLYPWASDVMAVPVGARPIHVGWQATPYGDGPKIWFLVPDVSAPPAQYPIRILPTGMTVDAVGDYIGTFETPTGEVFHVFEEA